MESGEHAEEGLGGDQAFDGEGGSYEVGDDDERQDDQDWQDDRGCVYDRVNDDQLHYAKHVCGDDISDLNETNLPLVLCEGSSSLERAGGLEVAAAPSLALRSPTPFDKLFSQMPLYMWPREAGILSLFGIPGLVHPGVPGAEDPDVTQWSLASSSPFTKRQTCLLLVAPPNEDSCPYSDQGKIDTDGQEEEILKEDESLLPLLLSQDRLVHDHPCPVEGRQSAPDYTSEDQSCPMLLAAHNTESCPVSDEENLEINTEDEYIPTEDESLLALVLWQDHSSQDPSSQDLPHPVAVRQSGPDDPSEDQTRATLPAPENTQSSPVSDEDIPDASQGSSSEVKSPHSHPVSPSHSHSPPRVVIKTEPDVEITTGSPIVNRTSRGPKHIARKSRCRFRRLSKIVSPTLRVEEPSSERVSTSSPGPSPQQSTCTPANQRKRRLFAIISVPLPNWEPPVIDVHTNDTGASSQVLDDTTLARQRQRLEWVRRPYSNPFGRGILSTGPSKETYAQFKIDSKET